jgi:small conductance mechanosensitive channel
MEDIQIRITEWAMLYGPKALGAIAIIILGRLLVGVIASLLGRAFRRSKVDETLSKFIINLSRALMLTFVIIAAIAQLGVETTSFVAILGAAGLAVGFALKDSLGNFAAGVMLIIFRPFKAGDWIEAGGVSGSVSEIGIFSSVLKTPDNKVITVPNGAIIGGAIINYSAQETRRGDLVLVIGYNDNIKLAKQTLEEIMRSDDRILSDPAPQVAVSELGDNSVNFAVRPWVKTADFWAVKFDITERVKLVFDEKGISIPYPQRDVHIHQVAAS